ncbi:hypothetical protein [Mycolicibacterium confluentis]|nr:hypothetical protein [Mycolicibacterium confluentis]
MARPVAMVVMVVPVGLAARWLVRLVPVGPVALAGLVAPVVTV